MDSSFLIGKAKEQGRDDIVEWIEAEIEKDRAAKAAKAAVPLDTPVGTLIPGRLDTIKVRNRTSGAMPVKTLHNVRFARDGWGGARLVYSSGKTAMYLMEWDIKRLVSITED